MWSLLAGILCLLTTGLAPPVAAQDDPDLDGIPGLAEPPAEPFAPVPSILTGTGSILIDRSHGNNFDVNGFMNFLASQGWVIAQHSSGAITPAVLAGYDILLVPCKDYSAPISPFSAAEVAAIQAFLADDNGLWALSDNGPQSGINTLSTAFGVVFEHDYIQDFTNNEGPPFWPTIHVLVPHPVTSGVESFGYYLGSCLSVSSPSSIIARADEDAYSLYCPAGSLPPTLAVWGNSGRAVFAGDITPLHPSYYPSVLRPEEQLLLQNIANWLLGPPPTAVSPASWGSVKSMYSPRIR